jgi:hypothetical protein
MPELESGRGTRRGNVQCMIVKKIGYIAYTWILRKKKKFIRMAYNVLKCGESGEEIKYESRKFKCRIYGNTFVK